MTLVTQRVLIRNSGWPSGPSHGGSVMGEPVPVQLFEVDS